MLKSTSSILVLLIVIVLNAYAQWSRCDGIEGGSILNLYQDGPTLLAASYRGIYASTDKGDHWYARGKFDPSVQIVFKLIRSGNYLLAGTGRSVIRSSDDGYTWNEANADISPIVFAYDFLADSTGIIVSSYPHIYRSENHGANWKRIFNGDNYGSIYQFASFDSMLFAATEKGAAVSTDGGYNWSDRNTGLPNQCTATSIGKLDTVLFLTTFGSGIFRSTNRGQSWIKSDEGINDGYIKSMCADDSFVYVISFNGVVYRSEDYGQNWVEVSIGLPFNNDAHKIYFIDRSLFVTTNAGIYRSTNQGVYWESKNTGIEEVLFTSFTRMGNTLFAGSYDRGVYTSTDYGRTWNPQKADSHTRLIMSLITDGTSIYAATSSYGIFKSTDNGTSWNNVSTGLKYKTIQYGHEYPYIKSIASNGRTLFACTSGGIYHSTNNGMGWSPLDSNIFGRRNAVDIAIHGNKIFLCVGYEIWFSDDNGSTWIKRNSPASINVYVSSIIYSAKYFYISTYGKGIYRSADDGLTYQLIAGTYALPNYPQIFICRDSLIIMGIKNEIYKSTDAGNSWINLKTNFSNDMFIRGLYLTNIPSGIYLFVGTNDGIWKYQLSSNNVFIGNQINLSTTFTLEQSYPNPFYVNSKAQQPVVSINYSVPVESSIKIIVYNFVGENVRTLVDNQLKPGMYQVKFDTSNLPSGTYYYSLQSGDVHLFRSMLILK